MTVTSPDTEDTEADSDHADAQPSDTDVTEARDSDASVLPDASTQVCDPARSWFTIAQDDAAATEHAIDATGIGETSPIVATIREGQLEVRFDEQPEPAEWQHRAVFAPSALPGTTPVIDGKRRELSSVVGGVPAYTGGDEWTAGTLTVLSCPQNIGDKLVGDYSLAIDELTFTGRFDVTLVATDGSIACDGVDICAE